MRQAEVHFWRHLEQLEKLMRDEGLCEGFLEQAGFRFSALLFEQHAFFFFLKSCDLALLVTEARGLPLQVL